MNAFAIKDFAADFGRDPANFNAAAPKAKTVESLERNEARVDDARIDRDDRTDFDRALRDQRDAPEQPKSVARQDVRERAPVRDAEPKQAASAEDQPSDAPEVVADTRPSTPAAAPAKPQTKIAQPAKTSAQGAQTDAAQPVALEFSTQVVVAPKAPKIAAPGDAQPDHVQSADANDASLKTGAECAQPVLTGQVAAAVVQPSVPTAAVDTNAAALNASLAAGKIPADGKKAEASALDAAAPQISAPEITGRQTALAAQSSPAKGGEPENLASPGVAAQAEAFNAALGKQAAPGAKPASSEKSETTPGATAQNPATGATPNVAPQVAAKPTEAAAGKSAATAQPTPEIKTADASAAPVFGAAAGRTEDHRPTAANTTHATNNTETVAKNVVHFFRQSNGGSARFEIRLDPVELGRVDARVEMNPDKTVSLTLSADRPETLAELMRTSRELEKQLTDSGLKLSDDGVKFRLNADAQSGQGRQNAQADAEPRRVRAYGEAEPAAIDVSANATLRRYRAGGVDVLA